MFLIVIGVLSILLAFPAPPYRLVQAPGMLMASVAVATLLPPVIALVSARRGVYLLERLPARPDRGQHALALGASVTHGALALLHGALLVATDWMNLCREVPVLGAWPVAPSLLAATPFLACVTLIWIANYPADRAIRQIALESQLLRGEPVRPVWTLGRYLAFNLRHQILFILIPMLLILLARDVIDRYQDQLGAIAERMQRRGGVKAAGRNTYNFLPDLLLGSAALLVAVVAPGILRHVWVTRPLPDGPLRDRLVWLCRKLRMRCREILVWHSGGMIINAAVMGVIAPLRYVMITDAMLERMDDTKIEAVFGHEAGHVKRWHIWHFLLFAFVSGCIITILSAHVRGMTRDEYQLATGIVGAILIAKWWFIFGWISRRFERQADLFGVRTLAISGLPCEEVCALHGAAGAAPGEPNGGAGVARARRGDPLCRTAARVFAQTLMDVARMNGITPDARSWRHGSIQSRSRTVERLAGDPLATLRFERSVARIQYGILIAALGFGLWAAWEVKLWALFGLRWFQG